jgi:hypothetical protein
VKTRSKLSPQQEAKPVGPRAVEPVDAGLPITTGDVAIDALEEPAPPLKVLWHQGEKRKISRFAK